MIKRIKLPTVLQYEQVECGAASLKIVLEYFGKIVPLTEVRSNCGVSRDGVTALDIKRAAISYDLEVKGYRCSANELYKSFNPPAIIFWNFNHFLVLEGFDDNFAYLSDPAMGRRKVTLKIFESSFTGVVLEFKKSDKFLPVGKKESLYKNLFRLLKPFKKNILFLIAIACLAAIPEFFIAGGSAEFIDSYLQQERISIGLPIIWITLFAFLSLIALQFFIKTILRNTISTASKRGASMSFVSLFSLTYSYFQQRLSGELADRLSLPIEIIHISLGGILDFFLKLVTGLVALIAGFIISPPLMIFIVSISLINASIVYLSKKNRKDANYRLYEVSGKAYGASTSTMQAIESVKACAIENENFSIWSAKFNEFLEELQKQSLVNSIVEIVSNTSTFIISTLFLMIGGLLIISGKLSLGELIAISLLSNLISKPISNLGILMFNIQYLDGELGRFNDVIDNNIEPTIRSFFSPDIENLSYISRRLSGKIELENLEFQFSKTKSLMFDSLNLTLNAGKHLALIGKSGSGKSTLLKLMCGLISQTKGRILFDGKSITATSDRLFRQSLSLVSQDPFIFRGSILDNLTLWDTEFNKNECLEILEELGLLEELGGSSCLNKQLNEGGRNISGGQRQRLEIARALLRKPTIMFMDEGTSALDEKRERKVIQYIKKKQCSLITVAHRLYSAEVSNHIIILEAGHIKEMGKTEVLLKDSSSVYNVSFAKSE